MKHTCLAYDDVGKSTLSVLENDYFTNSGICVCSSYKHGALRLSATRDKNGVYSVSIFPGAATSVFIPSSPSSPRTVVLLAALHATTSFHAPLSSANLHLLASSSAPQKQEEDMKNNKEQSPSTISLLCSWRKQHPWRCATVWHGAGGSAASLGCAVKGSDVLIGLGGALKASRRFTVGICTEARCRKQKKLCISRLDGRVEYTGEIWNVLGYVERRGRTVGIAAGRSFNNGRTRFVFDTMFSLPERKTIIDIDDEEQEEEEEIGDEYDHRQSVGTNVAFGIEHRPDEDTIVKARLDTKCLFKAVYSTRLCSWCSQAFSFTVNLADFSKKAGNSAAFSLVFGEK